MPAGPSHSGYWIGTDEAPFDRLFSDAPSAAFSTAASPALRDLPPSWDADPSKARRTLSIIGTELRIAPFVIRKWSQLYIHRKAISIDLERLPETLFRITVVHNFREEDRNPNLGECLAAIFLARHVGLRWEEAEDHPIECRSIEVLGYLDTATRRIMLP